MGGQPPRRTAHRSQEYSQVHPTGISRAAACGLLLCAVREFVLHRRVPTSDIVYFTVGFTDKSMSILLSREAWREVVIRIRTGPGVWVRYVTIRAEGRCVLGCWLCGSSRLHAPCSMRAHQHQGVGCCCSVCSRGSCHRGQVIHRRAPLQTTAPSVLLFAIAMSSAAAPVLGAPSLGHQLGTQLRELAAEDALKSTSYLMQFSTYSTI